MNKFKILELYKDLLYIGKYYPGKEYSEIKKIIRNSFRKNKNVQDDKEIEKLYEHGKYVYKEIEALISLKKYRTLKRNYYNEEETK